MTVNNKVSTEIKQDLTDADRKRLGDFLVKRLTECGWKDQLEKIYDDILEESKGQNVPNSSIMAQLNARAAPLIPESVKQEFREKLAACLGGPRVIVLPDGQGQLHEVRQYPIRVQVRIQLHLKNYDDRN